MEEGKPGTAPFIAHRGGGKTRNRGSGGKAGVAFARTVFHETKQRRVGGKKNQGNSENRGLVNSYEGAESTKP